MCRFKWTRRTRFVGLCCKHLCRSVGQGTVVRCIAGLLHVCVCAHWEGDTVDSDVKESDRSLLPSQPRGDVKKRFASLYTDNRYADAGE